MPTSGSELGAALQAWRARLSPDDVGLPRGGVRRVPGLRREELALLAGLSIDYLVRLEQGRRNPHPSPQTLDALARALRLSDSERDLLYRIAGGLPPNHGVVPQHVPAGIQQMMDGLADTPVAVFTATWNIVHWNRMWSALMGDPSALTGHERNMAWRFFCGGGDRIVRDEVTQDAFACELTANLRLAQAKYPEDRELSNLIRSLNASSTRFAAVWSRFEPAGRITRDKTVRHPSLGDIELDCHRLTDQAGDLQIIMFTAAPGSPGASSLALLSTIGTQNLFA